MIYGYMNVLVFGIMFNENVDGYADKMVVVYVKLFFFCLWVLVYVYYFFFCLWPLYVLVGRLFQCLFVKRKYML